MPRYKIIIENVDKAHEAFIDSYKLLPHAQQKLRDGPKRSVGTIHSEADSECPEDMPNCRNCGDPEFYIPCKKAGHCPDCGTKHGIAPDSVVAANGYKLVEV